MLLLLPRATLLVLCLATLSVAAPAPVPRTKRVVEAHPWSEAVDGLRVRLVPAVSRARLDESFRVYLEIQNVSDRPLALEEPILPWRASHPDVETVGWAITQARRNDREPNRLKRHEDVKRAAERVRLAPRQTLRIEITLSADHAERMLEELRRKDEDRKVQMALRDAGRPGTYELRATFRCHEEGPARRVIRDEWTWRGESLTSPPVRIELVK